MQTFFWLVVATALTVLGDFFIKLSTSHHAGMSSRVFVLGAFCYGLPAFAWYYMMQQNSLATIGVLYASATLIILALLGIVVFDETANWRDALGVVLALAAVLVMRWGR